VTPSPKTQRPAKSGKPRIPSTLIAVVIALAAAAWIGSGYLDGRWNLSGSPDTMDVVTVRAEPKEAELTRVRVATLEAQAFVEEIQASGETQSERTVEIRAETDGRVVELPVAEGRPVSEGALLLRLDRAERDAQLAEAKARVQQRSIQFEAARKLASSGFQSQTRRAEALADLEAAKASLAVLEVDAARTSIFAPFEGVLDRRTAEIGSFLQRGDHVGTLVDVNPVKVVAQVTERDVTKLEIGMPAQTQLAAGPERTGVVSYIATVADSETRTFRVEVEVANNDRRIGQGMSAELKVKLPPIQAQLVPPSIFRLDDQGRIGVMLVQDDNVVRFVRVTIIGSGEDGAYVTGLPDRASVVMVGQELVEDGETVTPVPVRTEAGTGAQS
jgi:multidrug efflux system membrane fusion protein